MTDRKRWLALACCATLTACAPAAPVSPPPWWPQVEAAPGALRRVILPPGARVQARGLYFLDVASGQIEGWVLDAADWAGYGANADNRWVFATGQERAYAARRATEAVYGWDRRTVRLVTAAGDRLLFARLQPQGAQRSLSGRTRR